MERSQPKKSRAIKVRAGKSPAPAPSKSTEVSATTGAAVATDDAGQWSNRRATAQATRAANARQTSGRRRFVDPTTCERDYSNAEMEFMQAMQEYKVHSGRMFPTWSEVLEVLKALGYAKPEPDAGAAALEPTQAKAARTA